MFIFGCVLLLFSVVVAFASQGSSPGIKGDSGHRVTLLHGTDSTVLNRLPLAGALRGFQWALAAFAIFLMAFSCFTSVSAGHVGVPVVYGSVQPYFIAEGLHAVNPFASVKEMSVRSQTYTMVSSENEGQMR